MGKAKLTSAGNAVREMRLAAKHKQEDMARTLGLDQSQISQMEKGRRKIPLQALLVLARACGFEVHLVSRTGTHINLETPSRYQRATVRGRRSSEGTNATA